MKLSKEVKIGLITTIAIACFIYGFNFLKGKNLFSTSRTFYAVYNNIDGLVEANPVLLNGYKIGIVRDITLLPDNTGKLLVQMKVDEDDINIPKNSYATISSSDLLGPKAIKIVLGNQKSYVKDGDTLNSGQEDGIKETVSKTLAPLQIKVMGLVTSIDSVMVTIHEVMNTKTKANLVKSFESIRNTLGSLETTSSKLDNIVTSEKEHIANIISKLNDLATTLGNNSGDLKNVIKNFSNISDSIAKSNIAQTIKHTEVALAQTAAIMTKINKGEGSMGMLINNQSLYNNLNASSASLDKLLEDLRLRPSRYLHFSVFGKKEKAPAAPTNTTGTTTK